ncbi:hypothetical protein ASPBRDRAFT_136866, partial [Aspergillus brasiliensis CBS 101740]
SLIASLAVNGRMPYYFPSHWRKINKEKVSAIMVAPGQETVTQTVMIDSLHLVERCERGIAEEMWPTETAGRLSISPKGIASTQMIQIPKAEIMGIA